MLPSFPAITITKEFSALEVLYHLVNLWRSEITVSHDRSLTHVPSEYW